MNQNDINILRAKIYQVHESIERLFDYVKGNDEVWRWAVDNDQQQKQASYLIEMASVLTEWSVEFAAELSNYKED